MNSDQLREIGINVPMRRTYNLRSRWGWKNVAYEISLFAWKGKHVFHRWHHSRYIVGLIWHDTTSKKGNAT